MPSSALPTCLSQAFAPLNLVVAGDNRIRPLCLKEKCAKISSLARRCCSGRCFNERPLAPARRSNTMRTAGVSVARRPTRLAAGWMRASNASNENVRIRWNHDLAVNGETSGLHVADSFDQLRKIARQRSARLRLQLDLSTVAENKATESIPLRFILPPITFRYVVDRKRLHRNERWCNARFTDTTRVDGIPARKTKPSPCAALCAVLDCSMQTAQNPDQKKNRDWHSEQPQQQITSHCFCLRSESLMELMQGRP
jgi:hypothetical protein